MLNLTYVWLYIPTAQTVEILQCLASLMKNANVIDNFLIESVCTEKYKSRPGVEPATSRIWQHHQH
jgi:hypothetical protein